MLVLLASIAFDLNKLMPANIAIPTITIPRRIRRSCC
jgi:hypothetical protein